MKVMNHISNDFCRVTLQRAKSFAGFNREKLGRLVRGGGLV
jgi:hypothetical protein